MHLLKELEVSNRGLSFNCDTKIQGRVTKLDGLGTRETHEDIMLNHSRGDSLSPDEKRRQKKILILN